MTHTKHTQSFTRTLTDTDTHVAISGGLTRKSGLLPAYQLQNTNWWELLSAWVCVCVCVCVCERSVSYLDVPVTNVRWNRSWDLTGDGGGYQLLTPLYMWTCRTEQKDTVKTLICINKLLFPNSIPSIPLPLRKVKMNSSCIDVSH